MSCPHSVINVPVFPSSQSSLRLDLDSCSTQLHCIALLDAGPHLLLKTVLGVGEGECGAKNLPGLVLRNPGSPLTQKVVHWLKGGEWALLKLLLLT
jgi:hypothetical protein